jgi:hypothetical protein
MRSVNTAETKQTDTIIRYATIITKMAHNAMFDYEDRAALYELAAEIKLAREIELQEPVCSDICMSAEAEDRLLVRREA